MNAVRDVRAILRVAVIQRDAVVSRTLQSVALFLAFSGLAITAFFALKSGEDVSGLLVRGAIGIGAFWLAALWLFLFVPGSTLMNSTANARLVPRQRCRLIQIAAVWWLLASAGIALAFANWSVMPLAGLYMLVIAMGAGGGKHAWIVILVAGNWHWTLGRVLPPSMSALVWTLPGQLAMAVLMLAGGAWVLGWLYPAGGDRHAERFARQVEIAQRFASRTRPGQHVVNQASFLGTLRLYAAALRRDCRAADPGVMLAHALGPAAHWSAWIPGMLLLLALACGARLALQWYGGPLHALVDMVSTIGVGAMAFAIAFGTAAYSQMMARTQGEQALLRLAPLTGNSRLLNSRLAVRLLRIAALNWAVNTGVLVGVTAVLGAGPDAMLRELALCCLAGQGALLGLLFDYARGEGWTPRLGYIGAGLAVAQVVLALGLASATGTTPWPWLIVSSGVLAVVQVRLGWHRMLAAAPAFPAGRLADSPQGATA